MSAEKYIAIESGQLVEKETLVTGGTAGDAEGLIRLNAAGKIDDSLYPAPADAHSYNLECDETLSANDIVNIFNDAGAVKVRKANKAGKPAHGYIESGTATVAAGNDILVSFGRIAKISTAATSRYLSTESCSATPASVTGQLVQEVLRPSGKSGYMIFSPSIATEVL